MTENSLFVDNPLLLQGIFEKGIFLAGEKRGVSLDFTGAGKQGILVLLHYPELAVLPQKALDMTGKIMTAVKWNQKLLESNDYAVLNPGRLPEGKLLGDVFEDFKPVKVLYWCDTWPLDDPEVLFYRTGMVKNVEILRLHSLHTVMADPDRKKAAWTAIRAFFGM